MAQEYQLLVPYLLNADPLVGFNAIVTNDKVNKLKNSNNQFLLSVSGYGDTRPLPCMESKEVCYSKDRRIDLRFIMEIPKQIKKSTIDF